MARTHTATFPCWDSHDPELTRILHRLRDKYELRFSERAIRSFVQEVTEIDETPTIKLRLIRHILDRNVLHRFHFMARPKYHGKLSREYKRLFEAWWNDQRERIRKSGRSRTETIVWLGQMVQEMPRQLSFNGKLKTELELALRELLRQYESAASDETIWAGIVKKENRQNEQETNPNQTEQQEGPPNTHGQHQPSPIVWLGPNNLLMDVFATLGSMTLVQAHSPADRAELIAAHFVDRHGNPFSKKSLIELERNTRNNNTRIHKGRPRQGPILEARIKQDMALLEQRGITVYSEGNEGENAGR